MTVLRALATGKVNLCLFLGRPRADGLHPLVSLVQTVSLSDELTLEEASPPASGDEVVCPGVAGDNLAAKALAAYRERTGWNGPPQRLTIAKRVPVAAGMGGGSSDAAAALRLVSRAAGGAEGPGDHPLLHDLATSLGSDVPALLRGGLTLISEAGEKVESLPGIADLHLVVVPSPDPLSTADVYREADRLGLGRDPDELAERLVGARAAATADEALPLEVAHNDLAAAAISLRPEVEERLTALRGAGADHVMVAGSGPTVFGLFSEPDARGAALELPGALAAHSVGAGTGAVREDRGGEAGQ